VPATASEAHTGGAGHAGPNGRDRRPVVQDPAGEADVHPGRPRKWLPRWTLRLRLTLLYGALFLVTGAVLLAITCALVAHSVRDRKSVVVQAKSGQKPVVTERKATGPVFYSQSPRDPSALPTVSPEVPKALRGTAVQLERLAQMQLERDRAAGLDALVTKSAIALGIMAVVSIALGWLMAGRALRPVRTMGLRARGISERNLHERLALDGPNDELKELGHAFDGLLARLESAFESQRRFVANASHELRTPITVERTLVEVALADPDANTESLRATCERVLAASEQQERMIEALLTLARSQRGLDVREDVDLASIAGGVLQGASTNGVRIESTLAPARTTGDPALVERLVANLVENAVHYNVPTGWVRASTGVRDGRATLTVTNSGPVIPPDRAAALIEPFRRLDGDRNGHSRGVGLGLSIVDAIATAHGAELRATPRDAGGLDVEIRFPASR
jgi:signal transduction histidine kinase